MRKLIFHTQSLKEIYAYGFVFVVACIFDFMTSELKKGNAIVFLDVSAAGNQVEKVIQSIDELLFYYDEMILKEKT